MIENQAYIVALMLLIASPIAIASDEGQAVLERFEKTPDDLIDIEKNDRTEALDDLQNEDIRDVVEDCYTIEQWKERLADYDWNKKDWEQESDEVREDDGARGNSDDKKEKEDYNKETDKVTDKDCFTEAQFEEFVDKVGSDERKDKDYEEDCVTIAQFRERLTEIREGSGKDGAWLPHERDFAGESGVGTTDPLDDESVVEYEEREWEQTDKDDSRCVGKKMLHHMKEKFSRDRGQKDYDRDYEHDWDENDEEWEELRAVMAELGEACDEGDEIACEELEELITELENDEREREEECDEHDEDDENNHEEEDEDDSEDEEDDSEDDDPENA